MSDGGVEKIDLEKVDWRGSREFFESLSEALDKLDDKDESYDFTWVGKRKSIIEAGAPINKTFRPDVDASKNWDTTENLFIEGDNLDALKLLQESYLGKVKMIYIDPPYNTGKDFVYRDNFKASVENYDEDTEYKDEAGNIQFSKNGLPNSPNMKSNGRYHSDWLSMIYPRLKLARNLLSEDGVIFISIDDNEQANLRKVCDEVFGEDNFINNIIWEKKYTRANDAKWFSDNHDFILVYGRQKDSMSLNLLPRDDSQTSAYSNPDNHPKGPWKATPLHAKSGSNTNPYTFINGATWAPPVGTYRRFNDESMGRMDSSGEIWFGVNGGQTPSRKSFLSEVKDGVTPVTIWPYKEVGHNHEASSQLKSLDLGGLFDNPKPTRLIERALILSTKPGDIVLDFFSGSATTAHAVMQLNAEDDGNRKWIMVQLPEETDEKSEAFKAGYKTIPEISRERIRRAGDKIAADYPDAKVDYGFRALRIDDTNHKDVYRPAADYQQSMLDELVDNVKEDRSDLDLLYGVLTATAWELNKPLETVELDGTAVYKYDYFGEVSGLVACFADEISEDTIKQIAQLKPLTAVFKESSFPNSQAKVNLTEHFRVLSPETKIKVI